MVMLSTETEEEIETLEQKLKIAKRKGHEDKVKKLASRLEKLRLGRPGEDYSEETLTSPRSKTPQSDFYEPVNSDERRDSYSKTLDSIVIVLEPRQIRAVAVSFQAVEIDELPNGPRSCEVKRLSSSLGGEDDATSVSSSQGNVSSPEIFTCSQDQIDISPQGLVSGNIIIHEAKNTDVVKFVYFLNYNFRSTFKLLFALIRPLISWL
jgi:hypothetical protein